MMALMVLLALYGFIDGFRLARDVPPYFCFGGEDDCRGSPGDCDSSGTTLRSLLGSSSLLNLILGTGGFMMSLRGGDDWLAGFVSWSPSSLFKCSSLALADSFGGEAIFLGMPLGSAWPGGRDCWGGEPISNNFAFLAYPLPSWACDGFGTACPGGDLLRARFIFGTGALIGILFGGDSDFFGLKAPSTSTSGSTRWWVGHPREKGVVSFLIGDSYLTGEHAFRADAWVGFSKEAFPPHLRFGTAVALYCGDRFSLSDEPCTCGWALMGELALTVMVIGCKVSGSNRKFGAYAIDLLFRIMKFFFGDESLAPGLSGISFFMDFLILSSTSLSWSSISLVNTCLLTRSSFKTAYKPFGWSLGELVNFGST